MGIKCFGNEKVLEEHECSGQERIISVNDILTHAQRLSVQ